MSEPGWVQHAVWWQVYPLGFAGADVHRQHRQHRQFDSPDTHGLDKLAGWLDYAQRLGCSGIALGPVFESATHGYDTIDHFRIDTRLGTGADFDRLVGAAHERGLKVLLDGVFNHVGRDFTQFRRVLEVGPEVPEAKWFRLNDKGRDGEPGYDDFEGHHELVALNHDSQSVADHVVEVMNHWLDRGADGWRLDAAYAVPDRFWAKVLPRVRERHPDAYVVGEVIHGDYARTVEASGLDSVTQYELWKAIWSSLNDRNLFELGHALERHDELLGSFVPLTFVGNHDVTRIASKLDDERHLPHALVVLFTVAGTPCVYYGDEQAFRGLKRDASGGDDEVRPAFPADEDGLSALGAPTFRLHQVMIGLRRRHPWLHRARTEALVLRNEQLVYRCRADQSADQGPNQGSESLVVALNLADEPLEHRADDGADGAPAPELLAGSDGAACTDGVLRVPAHGWAVIGR